ncbi:pectate lyase family protein [Streptomyces thermolilacinus]|uniref:pectate lyase family protein n=1 Tax=Streptomyces thermolilacinus TaxID=285540 RepID=UPI003406068D
MASPTHRRSRARRRTALFSAAAMAAAGLAAVPFVTSASAAVELARQTLPANDGWAAAGSGTTGGAKADAAHVFTVTNRAELAKALNSGSGTAPRVIRVKGLIDANGGSTCADYAAGTGYSLGAYLKAYDPAVWGRSKKPSGTQENARKAAAARQAKNIVFRVPSNTTLVGVPGTGAGIKGGSVAVQNVDNVIIRNLTFSATEDCFPQWDPTDGSKGEWNSAYDSVTLRGATHVWADHNTFTDAPLYDSALTSYFGRKYQVHDGALDITGGSDLVTVERNVFHSHDKTMLIGSSDTDSVGKLRVTLHHNVFRGITQRAPLARLGQIHLYNNHYDTTKLNGYAHSYSVNARAKAQIVAEHNAWTLSSDRKVSQLLSGDGTGAVAGRGNTVNGTVTDVVAAYNASSSKKLRTTVNWTPTLTAGLQTSAASLPAELARTAGAGVLTEQGTVRP